MHSCATRAQFNADRLKSEVRNDRLTLRAPACSSEMLSPPLRAMNAADVLRPHAVAPPGSFASTSGEGGGICGDLAGHGNWLPVMTRFQTRVHDASCVFALGYGWRHDVRPPRHSTLRKRGIHVIANDGLCQLGGIGFAIGFECHVCYLCARPLSILWG